MKFRPLHDRVLKIEGEDVVESPAAASRKK